MSLPSWQTTVTTKTAAQIRHRRWSRGRTLATAAGALLILYAGLLFAMHSNAAAAARADSPTGPTSPQTASTPAPDNTGDGSVSPTFLAEFDRLANNDGVAVREEFGADAQNPTGMMGTLAFSLLLIVALIYGGVWLYKRLMIQARGQQLPGGGPLLSVQESQAIGPNQKLHLVRMGDELLLIGATDQNISFLARYDGEQTNDSFADHLQTALAPDRGQKSSLDLHEGLQRLRDLSRSGFRGGSNG